MSNFDMDGYLIARYGDSNKLQELAQARQQKRQELFQLQGAVDKQMEEQHQQDQAALNSWVGKRGIGHTLTGQAINLAASLVSGTSRNLGHMATVPIAGLAAHEAGKISQEEFDAYNRYQRNEATEEDIRKLVSVRPDGSIAADRLQHLGGLQAAIRGVNETMDISSIVDPIRRRKLSKDLKEGFDPAWEKITDGDILDKMSGVAQLLVTFGSSAARNPGAVLEYMAENAPQLVMGAGSWLGKGQLAVSNLGYAADVFSKGVENYAKENNGQYPSKEQQHTMAMQALSLAAAEQASDMVTLGAGKLFGKAAGKATTEAIETGRNAARTSLLEAAKATAKAGAVGAAGESLTEGYQTWMEGKLEGKEATPFEIFEGTSIGGMTGGGLASGPRGAYELGRLAEQRLKDRDQREILDKNTRGLSPEAAKAVEEASKTGNVDALLKPGNAFSPDGAIAALMAHTQANPDQRDANIQKANEVLEKLNSQAEELRFSLRPDAEIRQDIQKWENALTKLAEDSPEYRDVQEQIQWLQEDLQKRPENEKNLAALEAHITAAENVYNTMRSATGKESAPKTENVSAERLQSLVEQTRNSADPEQASQAAEQIISLAMSNSGQLSAETASQLVEAQDALLTEDQRRILRLFSEARVAQNALRDMEMVSMEVLEGSDENMGLRQYQAQMAQNIRAGDRKAAERLLRKLDNWLNSHTSKAAAVSNAWDGGAGFGVQVHPRYGGIWEAVPASENLSAAARRKVAALELNSPKLVTAIAEEARAIQKTYEQLAANFEQAFKGAAPARSKGVAPSPGRRVPEQAPNQSNQSSQSSQNPKGGTIDVQNAPQQEQGAVGAQTATQGSPAGGQSQAAATTPTGAGSGNVGGTGTVSVVGGANGKQGSVGSSARKTGFTLMPRNKHTQKDQQKASKATAFIGRGSERSSTNAYANDARAQGIPVNPGKYNKDDVVFISAEGQRNGRIDPDFKEIKKAIDAGATILTDVADVRNTSHNVGERQVAEFLEQNGYEESSPGVWVLAMAMANQQGQQSGQSTAPTVEGSKESKTEDSTAAEDPQETEPTQTTTAPEGTTSTETTEASSKTGEETAATGDTPPGVLQALTDPNPQETDYKKIHLVARFFRQSAGKEGSKTKRPLVMVRDFLASMSAESVKEFLDKAPDSKQLDTLKLFKRLATNWVPRIQANLGIREGVSKRGIPASDYYYNDLMQFFQFKDEKGRQDVESNLKTAMSYAAFSWIAEQSGRIQVMDDGEINMLLKRDENHPVTDQERALLGRGGSWNNLVRASLGRKALDVLGMTPTKDAPRNLHNMLESVIGAHVLQLLEDIGAVESTDINMSELVESGEASKETTTFINLVEPDQSNVVKDIKEASRGSQNVLDRLFGSEPAATEPTFEPVPFRQARVKNTSRRVPKFLAKLLDKQNQVKNYVRQDMHRLVGILGIDNLLEIAGAEHVEGDGVRRQAALAASVEAKNKGLRRELENFLGFVDNMFTDDIPDPYKPFYFSHVMWKPQRVGISNNVINPQASKIHRHLITRDGWATTVDLQNGADMENFLLRVGESLGVKTDRLSREDALKKLDEILNKPEVVKGLEALTRHLLDPESTEMDEADQKAIVTAVKAGGEGMYSFSGLMALAQKNAAVARGETTFRSDLMAEVDGVTNGPMLSHVLMGAATTVSELFSMINMGGFFRKEDGYTSFNDYRSKPGNLDLYETVMSRAMDAMDRMKKEKRGDGKPLINPAVDAAVRLFTGNLRNEDGSITSRGRNLVKKPVTEIVFGSALNNTLDSMATSFLDSIYQAIEDSYNQKDGAPSREEIISALNTLFKHGVWKDKNDEWVRVPLLHSTTSMDFLMNMVLKGNHVEAIKNSFKRSLGRGVRTSLEDTFDRYLVKRDAMSQGLHAAYALYDAVYTAMRQHVLEQQMDLYAKDNTQGIPFLLTKNPETGAEVRSPLRDLSQAEENQLLEELKEVSPTLQTVMSNRSKDPSSGLEVAKRGATTGDGAPYTNEIRFGPSAPSGRKSAKVRAMTTVAAAPGVALVPVSTHSADSATSHMAQEGSEALNLHDAHGTGVGDVVAAAQRLNKALFQNLRDYSPLKETRNTLLRTVNGLAAILSRESTPDSVRKAVVKALHDIAGRFNKDNQKYGIKPVTAEDVLAALGHALSREVYHSETVRLDALKELAYLDQYAMEGGAYEVTEQDRQSLEQQKAGLEKKLDPLDVEAIREINKSLDLAAPSEQSSHTTQTDQTLTPEAEKAFGPLGQPAIKPDPELASFLRENPQASAKEVIAKLKELSKARNTPMSKFNYKLLSLMERVIDPNIKILLIEPGTDPASIPAIPEGSNRGWYNVAEGNIYVLGEQFQQSGLTPELMTHELFHAAVFPALQAALTLKPGQKGYSKEAAQVVNDLRALRKQAREHAQKLGMTERFAGALGLSEDGTVVEIHEFITWGMTSPGFQRILAGVQVRQHATNKLMKGWGAFVSSLASLWYSAMGRQAPSSGTVSGLQALFEHNAALFQRVVDMREQQQQGQEQGNQGPDSIESLAMENRHKPSYFSSIDIFESLGTSRAMFSPSANMQEHLEKILSGILTRAHGPYGLDKMRVLRDRAGQISAGHAWLASVAGGESPIVSQLDAAPMRVSAQEQYVAQQVEAVVQTAISSEDASMSQAYKELVHMFRTARDKLSAKDFHEGNWDTATQAEKDFAQSKYDFVFDLSNSKAKTKEGRNDYLARFAAMILAVEEFRNVIDRGDFKEYGRFSSPAMQGKSRPMDLLEAATRWYFKMLETISGWFNETSSSMAPTERAEALLSRMVDLELEHHRRAPITDVVRKVSDNLNEKGAEALQKTSEAVAWLLKSKMIQNSKLAAVRGVANMTTVVLGQKTDAFVDALGAVRDRHLDERNGVLMSLVKEVMHPTEMLKGMLRATKRIEQVRQQIADATTSSVRSEFRGPYGSGIAIPKPVKRAMTVALLRTGAHHLMDRFDMAQLKDLVEDKTVREQAISQMEKELGALVTPKQMAQAIVDAKALAYARITGRAVVDRLMLNPLAIMHKHGIQESGEGQQIQKLLAQMVAAYGLGYVDDVTRNKVVETMEVENNREEGYNGVQFMLNTHKRLEEEARNALFAGNAMQMVHGYLPEKTNPHTDIQVVTEREGQRLENKGYVRVHEVKSDSRLGGEPMYLYALKGAGSAAYLSGAISLEQLSAKGEKVHSGWLNPGTMLGQENAQINAELLRKSSKGAYSLEEARKFDPTLRTQTFLVPLLNDQGETVNWRYMMWDSTRDTVLERVNDFDALLGMMAGQIYGRPASTDHNRKIFEALKEDFDKGYTKDPNRFIQITAHSGNKEMRDYWNMLPYAAKEAIKEIWGDTPLTVRKESLDILFGYHKISAADPFRRVEEEREWRRANGESTAIFSLTSVNAAQKLAITAVEMALFIHDRTYNGKTRDEAHARAARAIALIARGERGWQELVREAKDIIVVKTGIVTLANQWSNLTLLHLHGVPWKDIWKHQHLGWKAAQQYRADWNQKVHLEGLLKSNQRPAEEARIRSELAIIEDSLARNPGTKLIEEGLLPTIVDDVSMVVDPYSFKSGLAQRVESKIEKLPKAMQDTAEFVYMRQDSDAYKFMSRAAQLSDFVGRYTLYMHLTTRKNNPLSHEEAVRKAADSFVNYDLPLERKIQYADDMGFIMFTKYFLRIQKVLWELFRERPASVLTMALVDNYIDLGPAILDSAWPRHWGNNPLRSGALELPMAFDDLPAVAAPLALIRGL